MPYNFLYFQTFTQQDEALEKSQAVFARKNQLIQGFDFFFWVVGDSHFIGSSDLGFYEVCSCKELPSFNTKLAIKDFPEAQFVTDLDQFEVITKMDVKPFSEDVLAEEYDLHYDFGPQALTGIKIFDDGYKTLHTYPEFGASVFSETKFRLKTNKSDTN